VPLYHRLEEMSKRLCVQFSDSPSPKACDDIFKKLSSFVGMFDAGVKFLEEEEERRCVRLTLVVLHSSKMLRPVCRSIALLRCSLHRVASVLAYVWPPTHCCSCDLNRQAEGAGKGAEGSR
jgi:hypothetical protein